MSYNKNKHFPLKFWNGSKFIAGRSIHELGIQSGTPTPAATTAFLLHLDGMDGETDPANIVVEGTWSASCDIISGVSQQLTATQKKFGSTSVRSVSGNGYFRFTNCNNNIGLSDYSVDLWFNLDDVTNLSANTGLFGHIGGPASSTDRAVTIRCQYGGASNNVEFALFQNGTNGSYVSTSINSAQWYHIAAVRKSGTVSMWVSDAIGGCVKLIDSNTTTYSNSISSTSILNYIGFSAGAPFNGYIDEIRVCVGSDGGFDPAAATIVPPSSRYVIV